MRQLHAVVSWNPVTPRLHEAVLRSRGVTAVPWLDELPSVIAELADRWRLSFTGQPESGSLGCVLFAEDSVGHAVVLKVPHSPTAGRQELEMLTTWAPRYISPQPLAYDGVSGAYLMERVTPGGEWVASNGQRGADDFARALDLLHLTETQRLNSTLLTDRELIAMRSSWGHEHATATGTPGFRSLVIHGQALAETMLHTVRHRQLVHGDLTSENLLCGADGLQVIDPMPAIGEREFDAALWVTHQDSEPILSRVEQLSRSGFDHDRLLRWVTALAALELRAGHRFAARQAAFLGSAAAMEVMPLDEPARSALELLS